MPLRVHYPSPPSSEVLDALGRSAPEVSFTEAAEAEVLIEGRPSREMLQAMPKLRAVVVPFAGVPEATLEILGGFPQLSLHNLHHNAPETAELAMALLLAAAKQVVPQDVLMRKHDWTPRYMPSRSVLLESKTALVLGYGEIGRRIAGYCFAMGMKVLAVRASVTSVEQDGPAEVHPASSLHEVLRRADVLIIALPQTSATVGLLGERELGLLPAGAILVNIARARIVDEAALYNSLKSGHLHSAGLDVWYQYPKETEGAGGQNVPNYYHLSSTATNTPPSAFPFHELENVVMSPHRGGVSMDTEKRRVEHLAKLLRAAAAGEDIPNQVDVQRGY
jgi:phosphoglycerate dehydrogenase-like enzyme